MIIPDSEFILRAAILYLPIATVALLFVLRQPNKKTIAAMAAGTSTTLAQLLALHYLAVHYRWWNYSESSSSLNLNAAAMPLDVWIGWTLLWGTVPALLLPRQPKTRHIIFVAAGLLTFDLICMPLLEPVVILSPSWLVGELVGIAFVLTPALLLTFLTMRDTHVILRALLQCIGFSTGFLLIGPTLTFSYTGETWQPLLTLQHWQITTVTAVMLPPIVMGLTAVIDFATLGDGTPLPLDSPKRLTTTGPYAYLANPMQTSVLVITAIYSMVLTSWWLATSVVIGACYALVSQVLSENRDLETRFGDQWHTYRCSTRLFIPMWKPSNQPRDAVLWVAFGCNECSQLKHWLESLDLRSITILDAETSVDPLDRITYDSIEGRRYSGVAALGKALEHVNIGFAFLGWILRFPVLTNLFQLIADASGFGPKQLVSNRLGPPK